MTDFLAVVTPTADLGPQDPATSTPPRRLDSTRRTSSVDITRPEGAGGPVVVEGHARDAVTLAADLPPACVDVSLHATLDPFQEMVGVVADPPEPALAALVGRRAVSGFRAAAADALPEHRRAASLLYLLLDDLPVVTLVSGYALQRAGLIPDAPRAVYEPSVDLCSGWAAEATIMRTIDDRGTPPMTLGPPAPALDRPDDPHAWHRMPVAAPRTVRRRRRIDVGFGDDLVVDAMFRDSHFDDDGSESAVHEYGLHAVIDPETLVVTEIRATPRVLPYVECPAAAASAARLVGFHLDDVRDRVRAELVGTSTCTHLNDLLRSLEDVRGLDAAFGAALDDAP